jgi:transcription-repair coupling factor (superfamily II helicase)
LLWDQADKGVWADFHSLSLERWQEAERLPFTGLPRFGGHWPLLVKELRRRLGEGQRVVLVSHQAARLSELLWEQDIPATPSNLDTPPQPGAVKLLSGLLASGWLMESPEVALFTDAEIFGFVKERRLTVKRPVRRQPFLSQFRVGDFVVHIEHGVAQFAGTTRMEREGEEMEYLVLEYAQGDRLFVPADQVDRIGRYFGPRGGPPTVSRLGTQEWKRTRDRVKKATEEVARELLDLYAARQIAEGVAFSTDTPWQQEMEAAFPYIETPDQAEAAYQVKADMERLQPMDRLVCGDVGYGKTEVAIRAAFKAVMDGRQVAILVPTTVLAQQHYSTFGQRLAPFPTRVEVLSRFRSHQEQAEVLRELREGTVDICIGTHRLLQKDVVFKDLGLVIVDEEQRFGVKHKERLKQMRCEVDVLTLSATPIPRTLYMSLAGVRDVSIMETPPEERLPVKTYVTEYDDHLVRESIVRELERGGQVFFVHNRVHSIREMARHLEALVPEARIAVAHGQMDEEELERVMLEFTGGRWDVLVCSTIIESGLDVPSANTLIINHADRLGLTQMYQLRGRVGRGTQRAYAYFLYHRDGQLTDRAQQRLSAIYEATELGAGFNIAMRDLEIRGAGNLLGTEQSGQMGAVGFELYTRLLAQVVAELKSGTPAQPPTPEPAISLPLAAFLPEDYVPDVHTRLALYQRLTGVPSLQDVEGMATELRDRFGPPPQKAANLLLVVRLRALARLAGVESIKADDAQVLLQWLPGLMVDRSRLTPSPGVRVGTSQVRISLSRDWLRLLEETLMKLNAPNP